MKYKQNTTAWTIFSVLVSLGLIVIAGMLLYSNWRILGSALESIKYRHLTETNLNELTSREIDLEKKVSDLETEAGMDKEIRERFPVAKPGEEVFMIVDNNNGNGAAVSEGINASFWQRLKSWWQSL